MSRPTCRQMAGALRFAAMTGLVLIGLSGCAELMLVSAVTTAVVSLPSNQPHWVETNRLAVGHAPGDVYAVLEQEVEKNERSIVERDAPSLTLRVSYPFSWLRNHWGGTIRIRCVAAEFGTTVVIEGDGRDPPTRVRAIGNQVLGDLDSALRRLPRTL